MGEDHPRAARPARLTLTTPVPRIVEVEDPEDPRLADFARLTDVALRTRIEQPLGVFIAEGSLVIERALAAGYRLRAALVSPKWLPSLMSSLAAVPAVDRADPLVYVGSESLLQEVTGFHVHRGALAALHRRPVPDAAVLLSAARRVVVIEDMVSHTNLGAVFRSAGALGMDAVLLTPSSADPLYRRSVRVSMGGVFSLPWGRLPGWPEKGLGAVRRAGFSIWALTPAQDAEDLSTVEIPAGDRVALLLGTEGDGLSAAAMAGSDRRVRIPMMRDMDSLNVAAAAAVAFYALRPGIG